MDSMNRTIVEYEHMRAEITDSAYSHPRVSLRWPRTCVNSAASGDRLRGAVATHARKPSLANHGGCVIHGPFDNAALVLAS